MDASVFRIRNTIKKILPWIDINIDKGKNITWIDLNLDGKEVSIEFHSNKKFGICIPNKDKSFLRMADYYVDNHIDAIDLALKLLME